MSVRAAEKTDIAAIAEVYQACFPSEKNHALWIESSFNTYPRGVYYVVEVEGQVRGYILWCVKNGFWEKVSSSWSKSVFTRKQQVGGWVSNSLWSR